ncbi:MAG: hypothetical protein OHK0053_30490 [Microscillaceae bacterium]
MKTNLYYFLFLAFIITFFSCGGSDKQKPDAGDSIQNEGSDSESTPTSEVITEAFNNKDLLTKLFQENIGDPYVYNYKQIGEEYCNGGYRLKDTLAFKANLIINIQFSSLKNTTATKMEMSEEGRNQELERMQYFYKEDQRQTEGYRYEAEEIEIDGRKAHLFYRIHWFAPKNPKDTIENKKHELQLYFRNEVNYLKVTAFPSVYKNLTLAEWKEVINKETLKKHAVAVAEKYIKYF